MGNCPKCHGKRWLKTDKKNKDGIRYWKCWRCGTKQIGDYPFTRDVSPSILYIDIETSLTELYNYGLKVKGEWVSYKFIKKSRFIICWSAQWVGKDKIYSACVTKKEAIAGTDKNILAPLYAMMDKADIIAGHNSNKFDIPIITAQFVANGYPKLEIYKTYDTKIMAKRHKFESNSLEYLCRLFGFGTKDKMELEDWIAIQETGDERTLRKMLKYNRGDVRNGVKVLGKLVNWHNWPREYGTRMFPNEPKDTQGDSNIDIEMDILRDEFEQLKEELI